MGIRRPGIQTLFVTRPPHRLDSYCEYIFERYDAGLDNVAQIARELRQPGHTEPDQTVSRYLVDLRRTRKRGTLLPPLPWGSALAPSPRETAWLLRDADAKPAELSAEELAFVHTLEDACPTLAAARALTNEFVQMLEHYDANALDSWLAAAEDAKLKAFAAGLRCYHYAVPAAVHFRCSNGQVESHLNRVKLLKRGLYGRGGFALLRKRVSPRCLSTHVAKRPALQRSPRTAQNQSHPGAYVCKQSGLNRRSLG